MTPCDVLRAAADLIKPKGVWCKGSDVLDILGRPCSCFSPIATHFDLRNSIARVCIIANDFNALDPALDAMVRYLGGEKLGDVQLGKWNDHPDRTQASVVASLRAAADADES